MITNDCGDKMSPKEKAKQKLRECLEEFQLDWYEDTDGEWTDNQQEMVQEKVDNLIHIITEKMLQERQKGDAYLTEHVRTI